MKVTSLLAVVVFGACWGGLHGAEDNNRVVKKRKLFVNTCSNIKKSNLKEPGLGKRQKQSSVGFSLPAFSCAFDNSPEDQAERKWAGESVISQEEEAQYFCDRYKWATERLQNQEREMEILFSQDTELRNKLFEVTAAITPETINASYDKASEVLGQIYSKYNAGDHGWRAFSFLLNSINVKARFVCEAENGKKNLLYLATAIADWWWMSLQACEEWARIEN